MARSGSLGVRRRASRLAAVQALYQIELAGKTVEEAILDFQARRAGEAVESEGVTPEDVDVALFADIVTGVVSQRAEIDVEIAPAIEKHRDIARIEVLLRLILRAGTYELRSRKDIDAALTINEYVAVAQAFFAGPEPGFVNGVLDRIARTVRDGAAEERADGDRAEEE